MINTSVNGMLGPNSDGEETDACCGGGDVGDKVCVVCVGDEEEVSDDDSFTISATMVQNRRKSSVSERTRANDPVPSNNPSPQTKKQKKISNS